MGWGRMLLLGNIGQQFDIEDIEFKLGQLEKDLNNNQKFDHTQEFEIAQLRKDHRELKLYLICLVQLLENKGVLNKAEIEKMVIAVDENTKRSIDKQSL